MNSAKTATSKRFQAILESYCKRQGWAVYDIYVDDDYTGTNFDRPAFQRMYQDVVDAKVNVIVSKDTFGL